VDLSGLTRFVVLFFIDLKTRRVEVGGIARSANGLWMSQIARNLTDAVNGFFGGKRYLIHDRDPLYTKEFLAILADSGIESVKLPVIRQYSSTAKSVTNKQNREKVSLRTDRPLFVLTISPSARSASAFNSAIC
jgi:putative transposase